ncbi:MAG: AMP-binding protein [Acidimicrobiales bacterium]
MNRDWQLRAVPAELERGWIGAGWWNDYSLGQILDRGLRRRPALPFRARSTVRPWEGTLGQVRDLARRVAGGLAAAGVVPGDTVAFQLPNWVEAAATFWGAAFLGAVVVPIVHFYGAKEVGYILRRSQPRAFVTGTRFGHIDFLATLEPLLADLDDLAIAAIVGDDHPLPTGTTPFRTLAEADPLGRIVQGDPSAPALVAYTSGTTSDPKGVVHSHRTIGSEIRQLGAVQPEGPPTLVGAPVGHGIGMLSALLLPVHRGQPIELIDVWEPGTVLAAMARDGLSSGAGATFFLTSLLDHPDFGPRHAQLMARIGLGGAAVPAAVAERATTLGISIVRMYGSTEHPSITGATHEDPLEKRIHTDGRPLPGVEIRLVDDLGHEVAPGPGATGNILSRGPDCFIGYTRPELTEAAFDRDGWYATEDVGTLDGDGYLLITDRRKDIIIRGGENISAAEVEELLARMPGVAEVAVVAAPDLRLGEHACAFLRMTADGSGRPRPAPDLAEVRAHLEAHGLTRQKWPEELRAVEDFPRTASGKVQKFALRDQLRGPAS